MLQLGTAMRLTKNMDKFVEPLFCLLNEQVVGGNKSKPLAQTRIKLIKLFFEFIQSMYNKCLKA
jgi:hypothetical protein